MNAKRSRAAFETDNPPAHAPFALYGTPFPAYDPERREDGSKVPIWQQQAVDEQGRKRFHGAFTGGYSAGYFNSVGSAEGFVPKTFVSSRQQKKGSTEGGEEAGGASGTKRYSLEDAMDEEDRADREDKGKLHVGGGFAGLGGDAGSGMGKAKGEGMFGEFFRSEGDGMGSRLLRKMGWRQGEGVGPKIMRRAKGDKEGPMHEFAPADTGMIGFERKTNHKGLGFAGEGGLGVSFGGVTRAAEEGDDSESGGEDRFLRAKRTKIATRPKKKVSGLGMGVLNDTGSDDEDPYSIGPKLSINRTIGGAAKKKKKASLGSGGTGGGPTVIKPSKQRATKVFGFRKCHDGRLPIDGFVLAISTLNLGSNSTYPPPTVPTSWTSSKLGASATDLNKPFLSTSEAAKASALDPKARAKLLGEASLKGKSIFDYISATSRERLATASGATNLPQAKNETAPSDPGTDNVRSPWAQIPPVATATAVAALDRGRIASWPYNNEEGKLSRYIYFLELQAGLQKMPPQRPTSMATTAWVNEMQEFANTAEIYKPLSKALDSQFTRGTHTLHAETGGLDGGTKGKRAKAGGGGKGEAGGEDPARNAARMGMHGPLTRTTWRFDPGQLTCKRFGVKHPGPVPPGEGRPGADEGYGRGEDDADDDEDGDEDVEMKVVPYKVQDETAATKPKSWVAGGTEWKQVAPVVTPGGLYVRGTGRAGNGGGEVMQGVETTGGLRVPGASPAQAPGMMEGVVTTGGLHVPGAQSGTGQEKESTYATEGRKAADEIFKDMFGDNVD